tara:strand:+ start:744 stop:1382 length:639 start_codon:yes stop_codon:yes gene_type:complete
MAASKKLISSTFIETIYKSRNVLLDYLKKEKFVCDDYDEFSISEIAAMVSNNQLDLLLSNENKSVYVKYHLEKTLRPAVLYDIIEDLYNTENVLEKKDDLIIIVKDEPNDSLLKTLKTIWDQDEIFIVVFSLKHLLINVLEHSYVPKHIKLNNDEKDELYKKYNIEHDLQMPEISRFDPVARAIMLRPNEVCKIIRYTNSSYITDFYRICCS